MLLKLLMAGLSGIEDYAATHVLTCLVPAFFLAGAMVTFINRQAVINSLGARSSKPKSFALASAASFFVSVCSCTVIPVSSGLYYAGAGIGAAFIVLWVAPAANVLALIYTGSILGAPLLISRIAAAIFMAFVVGYTMSWIFSEEEDRRAAAAPSPGGEFVGKNEAVLLLLLTLSLLIPNYLGAGKTYLFKVAIWAAASGIAAVYAVSTQGRERLMDWMRETWWFVRTIFPLLLAGVFLVGVLGEVLPEELIRRYLGGDSLGASFAATALGSITYFATMTEAPFVDKLMKLGMGPGPALALLLTGPGLSLPNWLAIAKVFGPRKAFVYVSLIIALGTIMGWFFGNFIL